tara:strand:+ start:7429 stop:8646 length:1218 start_codon:yes stop_codon:yes gene_type:complete
MHIDKLLERENFQEIFKITLEKFFLIQHNKKLNISWNIKNNKNNNFLVNSKLNIIFHEATLSKNIFPYIFQFLIHKNKLRSFAQNSFFRIVISKYFRSLFSNSYISISPFEKEFKNYIFLGGNHSISLILLDEGTSTQILKYNYDPKFIIPSIETRIQFPYLPIPKLYSYSVEDYWVKQQWIKGIPINRIANKKLVYQCISSANKAMINLYEDTYIKEPVKKWFLRISNEIENSIIKLSDVYDEKFIYFLKSIIQLINDKFFTKEFFCKFIYTSITHGDYNGSNIIHSDNQIQFENNTFLIDWDYCKRRFIMYDFIVLKFNSRTINGLYKSINLFMNNKIKFNYSDNYLFRNFCDNYTKLEFVGLFLLEDISVRIFENDIPNLNNINNDLINYFIQLKRIIKVYG